MVVILNNGDHRKYIRELHCFSDELQYVPAGILFALSSRVVLDSIERAATAIPMTAPQDYSVI